QAQEHMFFVSAIPSVKFAGLSPTGLNASSEGEIRVFYDTIAALATRLLKKPLKKVLDIIQLSEFGDIDP
ncbi:phage portal protein, partial [Escherichia coli]